MAKETKWFWIIISAGVLIFLWLALNPLRQAAGRMLKSVIRFLGI